MLQAFIHKTTANPKLLFAIDGLGALLSALLLGLVLTRWESIFGMPREALYVLAAVPCLFASYDLICYLGVSKNWVTYLRIIAIANLAYCCLAIAFVVAHFQALTVWGLTYFLLELAIVLGLVYVELRTAAYVKKRIAIRRS